MAVPKPDTQDITLKTQNTIRTVVYKTVDNLEIKADVYTHVAKGIDSNTPVVLYFHGGAVVGCNRQWLPAHVVQSCLKRGWVLVSADFRQLPQVTGKEIVKDAQDAYSFIRNKLWGVLNNIESTESCLMPNIIVSGPSGGGVVTFTSAHYLKPQPLALLIYYGAPTIQADWFNSSKIHIFGVGPGTTPLIESQVSHFLAEPVTTGYLNARGRFDLAILNDDISENKNWVRPGNDSQLDRTVLFSWLLQTNGYPKLLEMVDKDLDDKSWTRYPKTVLVHGTHDVDVPYQGSLDAKRVIGPHPAQLFTVEGQPHAFDTELFLGDPGLKEIEEAWDAIEKIVNDDAITFT